MRKLSFLFAAVLLSVATYAQTWSLDRSHAKVGFSATHLMISETEGQFKKFDAKLTAEKPDFTDAVIEVTIDAASIFTDEEKRDEHLRSPDFFDVEKYPNITFKSKSLKKVKDKNYKLVGDLTIKDVTKQVEFDVIFNGTTTHPYKQKTVAGFKVRGVVKRSDFKLNTGMPTAILSDEIAINSGVEFIKD